MDDDLIGQLLDVVAARLAAYGYLLTGSATAGDKLVEDAIVSVCVRHRRLNNIQLAEGHVRVAMRTTYLSNMRAAQRRARFARPGALTKGLEDAAAPVAGDRIGRALAVLSPQERAVVVLRHYDQLRTPEIAAAMRTTEGAVERHLSQAHAKLAVTLGDIEPELDRILVVDTRRG